QRAGPAQVIASAPSSIRRSALRRGIAVQVNAPAGAGVAAVLKVGARSVASGTTAATADGPVTVTRTGSSRAPAAAFRPQRKRAATLTVSLSGAGLQAQTESRRLTIRR